MDESLRVQVKHVSIQMSKPQDFYREGKETIIIFFVI